MALTPSEVRVAGTGGIFIAPVGSTMPLNPTTALDAAFVGLGYTTEEGVTLTRSIEREPVNAWQAVSPVRYVITGQSLTIQANLLQANKDTFKLWLNSGDFTVIGASSAYKADIPTVAAPQQFSISLDWSDGSKNSRLAAVKAEVIETGDMVVTKAGLAIPITFSVIPPDTGSVLATYFTNDAAFTPAA